MIHQKSTSLKTFFLWCFILIFSLIAAYLSLISLFSVWVGFEHIQQFAFWVPILAGAISIAAIFCIFVSSIKYFLKQTKNPSAQLTLIFPYKKT